MEQLFLAFRQETANRISLLKSEISALLGQLNTESNGKMRILRRIFQQIHTLKGSASAFELRNTSLFAHEIEDIIEEIRAGRKEFDKTFLDLLEECILKLEDLIETEAEGNEIELPKKIIEKLNLWKQESTPLISKNYIEALPPHFPPELFEKLNQPEKKYLHEVLRDGARIFLVEVAFSPAEFGGKFALLRNTLRKISEVIATLPGVKTEPDAVSLLIICAGDHEKSDIQKALNQFSTEISLAWCGEDWETHNAPKMIGESSQSVDLENAVAQAVLAGKQTAQALGKNIRFEVIGSGKVSKKWAEAIATAILHLIRNAVDHGIESPAERLRYLKNETALISIKVSEKDGKLIISISDDGGGIDVEEIKQAVKLRGWTQKPEELSEEESLRMILKSGFSTADLISPFSGRGIGLHIVQNVIGEIGGEIRVRTHLGNGTDFEIILPLEN